MRKMLLSLAGLALIANPAFAGKFNKVVNVGDKAPTFAGIPATLDGQDTSLTLSDIKDPLVVLVFVNKGCPVVLASEDRIIDVVNDYKDKGVKFVGISVIPHDNLTGIKDYIKEKKANYVYGYDETQAIGKAYGASRTPEVFVLDKDRNIRYMGAIDDSANDESKVSKKYLRAALDSLLDGKAPETTETRAVGCGIGYKR